MKRPWSEWRLIVLRRRLQKRYKASIRVEHPHRERGKRTWTDASQANLTKLRYRHANPYQENERIADWDAVIQYQRRKLEIHDPHHRWQRREFFILEKMNKAEFVQIDSIRYGSTWSYVATMQAIKGAKYISAGRRKPSLRKHWSKAVWYASERHGGIVRRDEWEFTVRVSVRRANQITKTNGWEDRIWQAWKYFPVKGDSNSS